MFELKPNITELSSDIDSNSDVTVIINLWKRNYIEEQIKALLAQTCKPSEIWLIQCGNHICIDNILQKYPFLELLSSSVNLKYFGRFSFAQYVSSKYVYLLDDDVIPSANWIHECKSLCIKKNAVVASSGRLIPNRDFYPERSINVSEYFVGDNNRHVPYNHCSSDTVVDFGCNSWFLQTDWLKHFWQLPPCTLETAEDIHLSASCKIKGGIATIVPAQPDLLSNGNIKKYYGHDELASWKQIDFIEKRSQVIKYLIDHGWMPLKWL